MLRNRPEGEGKSATFRRGALDSYCSTQHFRVLLADRQTEAGSLLRGRADLGLEKRPKQHADLIGGDTRPGVLDPYRKADLGRFIVDLRVNSQLHCADGGELDGIAHQIRDDLTHLYPVRADATGHVPRPFEFETYFFLHRSQPE